MMHTRNSNYCVRIYAIGILNPFYLESQLINTQSADKDRLKYSSDESKMFKTKTSLLLENKK